MASYLAYIPSSPAFPQLVQPHSTQVQPPPSSRSVPPPLCNDTTEGKIEKRERQEQLESAPLFIAVNRMYHAIIRERHVIYQGISAHARYVEPGHYYASVDA